MGADGSKIEMIPIKEVMSEKYVAYFMTAGTKPPQPKVVYCPHSVRETGRETYDYDVAEDEKEQDLVSAAGPPSPSPPLEAPRKGGAAAWVGEGGEMEEMEEEMFPTVSSRSRGVAWNLAGGRITHSPLQS